MAKKGKADTPLMKQYNQIKAKYPGALLLFRVGDFYETFGEDAIKASKILNITLTKRGAGSPAETELAGFPHHALDTYLPKLVRAGQRVAICDQLEDPKNVKGIVKRGVTELVTPGVSYNDTVLDTKHNNYLAAVHFEKKQVGISFADISTGEFFTAQGNTEYIDKLLQSFNPSEVIFCKHNKEEFFSAFGHDFNTYYLEDWVFKTDHAIEKLKTHFKTSTLKGFGIEGLPLGIITSGAVLFYLEQTEHKEIQHISRIARVEEDHYVWLDKFTIRNLELVFTQHETGIPLIDILDYTITPMGGRLLKKWVLLPLKDKAPIEERLKIVRDFSQNEELEDQYLVHLKPIGDLERLISKVAARRINPREMLQLKRALNQITPIKNNLNLSNQPSLKALSDRLNLCEFLRDKIETELREDPPIVINQGNMIKEGIHEELDELRTISNNGKNYLRQLQEREMEKTGIPKIKVAYNKVFGYYLEVSKTHADKVPEDWIRKQTLVNAERFITPELKEYEEKIITAEEKIHRIEQELFMNLVISAGEFVQQIQANARVLAKIDCLLSFAQVANKHDYIEPQLTEEPIIDIKDGRHPVIETQMPTGERYIPNDVYLDNQSQQIMIITGPNMAGKSALLRQVALISLMAQMGSFVPASSVKLGLVDKVFTRVGASDNLSQGESTFMVEMTETASILNNLSERSLVLMDEIGRGTSTYDGISIAWSIVEYLHNHPNFKAKTLFATHYHELNELTNDFSRIKNFNVSVKEAKNKIIFMRKLKEGGSEHSFGIHVAQLAGMPQNVVMRANEILVQLEKDKSLDHNKEKLEDMPKNNFQLSLFEAQDPKQSELIEKLKDLDVNSLSPIEALLKLNELKEFIS